MHHSPRRRSRLRRLPRAAHLPDLPQDGRRIRSPALQEVQYYDYHTLKRKPLRTDDLRDFIDCYHPTNRHKRKETWNAEKNPEGRWRKYSYDELAARDKTSLDLFWLKDDSLADLDNLPDPADLADEIIENIEAGLLSFRNVAANLAARSSTPASV